VTDQANTEYRREDFISDQTVRWCPGCGDYSILAQVQRMMPQICAEGGFRREDIVFVSGIGCSSRFPYYMNTYGFHTIHGRAPTVALGLKIARPDLQVWVITGDGDGLSIGGNHLIHTLRRNLDVKILLFNNRIYGLTKGQYSPTSEFGKRTKSSPLGVIAKPVNPVLLACASRASFIARTIDTDTKHLQAVLLRAARHRGSAFVEIYQNCNIFNDLAFEHLTDRAVRSERLLYLQHGKPLTFGNDGEKAIVSAGRGAAARLAVADRADVSDTDIVVHDEGIDNDAYAYALGTIDYPEFPVPVGVFRAIEGPTFDDLVADQITEAQRRKGPGDLEALMHSGEVWTVE
jgi:2-oxoglutarate ferredoxin oxidoreductase subunit beta